jgi:predicted dinucleotide-binding enzyme
MKYAIIGSGKIGTALARAFARQELQGDILSDSEVLHIFTVNSGLIASMDLGDEANTTSPTAAFSHRLTGHFERCFVA